MKTVRFDILTIFPKIFDSYTGESLIRRAIKKRLIDIRVHNLRDFTDDPHHKVDDRPFGGGPGMVLKVEPLYRAVTAIRKKGLQKKRTKIILFSPHGKRFTARRAKEYAAYDRFILICGRYEGVDHRIAQHVVDEEVSIGEYVLSGGELPALVFLETISRFLPGFLGKEESLEEIKGSYPVFTKPSVFSAARGKKWKVPPVLLSGNHARIDEWRRLHRKD